MAQITWRNVDAPDLTRASTILNQAATQWDSAFGNLSDTFTKARENQIRNRSAEAIPILARVANEAGVTPALDAVGGMIAPQDMSPELQQAMLNLQGLGMGYDETRVGMDARRATTAAVRGGESREQTRFDRAIADEDYINNNAGEILRRTEDAMYGTSERDLLAMTIAAEAGGEGFEGKQAVGAVIGNRARQSGQPISSVITAPGQFSWLNGVTGYAGGEGGIDPSKVRATEEDYRIADDIISGRFRDPTNGATHYYNPSVADPDWGMRAGGDWMRNGNHVFGRAGGFPSSGSNLRLSDLVGEGRAPVGALMDILNSGQDMVWDERQNRDDNRDRDKAYRDTILNEELTRQAQEIVADLARTTAPSEMARTVADMDLDPKLTREVLNQASSLPIEQMQAPTFDEQLNTQGVPGLGFAQRELTSFKEQAQAELAGDLGVRIENNAQSVMTSGEAALGVMEKIGKADEDPGATLSAINTIVDRLAAKGVKINPEQAGMLLEETAGEGGLIFGNGKVEWDVEKALAIGEEYLSPAGRQASREVRMRAEGQIAAADQQAAMLEEATRRMQLQERQTQGPGAMRPVVARLIQEAAGVRNTAEPTGREEPAGASAVSPNAAPSQADPISATAAEIQRETDATLITAVAAQAGVRPEFLASLGPVELEAFFAGEMAKATSEAERANLQAAKEALKRSKGF